MITRPAFPSQPLQTLLRSDKKGLTASSRIARAGKALETEGDAEENTKTLDGKIFLEKYGYLTSNEKHNNFVRKEMTRVKLNIPGQIIENLRLFDNDGKEIGKRNPFKKINAAKRKALRQEIKEYSRKIVRTGLKYQEVITMGRDKSMQSLHHILS